MKLKNYTSGVPVSRTVGRIEELLASAGASSIQKTYSPEGRLDALIFSIAVPGRNSVSVRLPVNHEGVYKTMRSEIKRPRTNTLNNLEDQALRTSWKLMQDWVEVQLSLIRMQQVDFLQVFLPYVWDGEQTFYTRLKSQNYNTLLLN